MSSRGRLSGKSSYAYAVCSISVSGLLKARRRTKILTIFSWSYLDFRQELVDVLSENEKIVRPYDGHNTQQRE